MQIGTECEPLRVSDIAECPGSEGFDNSGIGGADQTVDLALTGLEDQLMTEPSGIEPGTDKLRRFSETHQEMASLPGTIGQQEFEIIHGIVQVGHRVGLLLRRPDDSLCSVHRTPGFSCPHLGQQIRFSGFPPSVQCAAVGALRGRFFQRRRTGQRLIKLVLRRCRLIMCCQKKQVFSQGTVKRDGMDRFDLQRRAEDDIKSANAGKLFPARIEMAQKQAADLLIGLIGVAIQDQRLL